MRLDQFFTNNKREEITMRASYKIALLLTDNHNEREMAEKRGKVIKRKIERQKRKRRRGICIQTDDGE